MLGGGVNYIFPHDTLSICIGKYDNGRENGYLLFCPQGYFVGCFTQAFYSVMDVNLPAYSSALF